MKVKATISLTGIFIQDENDGGFTGFITQVPGAVSEGDTIDEAAENLMKTLPDLLELESRIEKEQRILNGSNVITKNFEFELK